MCEINKKLMLEIFDEAAYDFETWPDWMREDSYSDPPDESPNDKLNAQESVILNVKKGRKI